MELLGTDIYNEIGAYYLHGGVNISVTRAASFYSLLCFPPVSDFQAEIFL